MSGALVLAGSVALFAIDVRKYHMAGHSHTHRKERSSADAGRPRTPGVASEQNTADGADAIELQLDDECPPSCRVPASFLDVFLVELARTRPNLPSSRRFSPLRTPLNRVSSFSPHSSKKLPQKVLVLGKWRLCHPQKRP